MKRRTKKRSATNPASTAPGHGPSVTVPLAGMALVALGALLCLPSPATAQGFPPGGGSSGAPAGGVLKHEPVFGIGPQTIWQGGLGPGIEFEYSRHVDPETGETEEETGFHAHLDYGITEDLTLRVAMPLLQRKTETSLVPGAGQISRDATGVGDAVVRAKYRFWHRFSDATQYHASLVGGVKLPVASSSGEPALGTGSIDFLAGATISRDGLRYYLWTSAVARISGEAFGRRRGNEYRYDAAVGFRPWVPSFTGIDPLLLLEFNGLTADQSVVGSREQAGTGGTILALSPAFWLTYRNYAFKGGVKLPVYQELGAEEKELDYTLVAEFEVHM